MKKIDQAKEEGSAWWSEVRPETEILVLRGDNEKAIDVLEQAYDQGVRLRAWRHYPIFAPIRDHPRFVALFDKIDEDYKAARIEMEMGKPSKSMEPN